MSIKQQRTMTEKNLAAHRENARKSRGPVTSEGKDRRRDASLRHGFYSQDRDKALRALGEDPRDFDAMVNSVREKYEPADGFEEALAMRLARAMWRMDRADRIRRVRAAAGQRRKQLPGGPAACANDAAEDDRGKFAVARSSGGAGALRYHARPPRPDEELAAGRGGKGNGRNRSRPLPPTSGAGGTR